MRIDRVVRETGRSLRQVLEGLDHNLTARDNFAPEGEEGWVLTSRGPDHTPEYAPVDATIDWDAITGTPNSLAGYGIEDAYTVLQVNTLIATHTHDASAIVSGILNPSRLGSGAPGSGTYLRGDNTWQPLSLGGLGIASEVASIAAAAAALEVASLPEPEMVPGPPGPAGPAGAAGPPGSGSGSSIQWRQEEFYEENWTVPGPTGQAGAPGAAGATGPSGALIQLIAEEHYDEFTTTPGPQGNLGFTGAQGPPGMFQYTEEHYNDEYTVPGPQGNTGTTGAQGPVISAIYLEHDVSEEPWIVPGPVGATGPQGAAGAPGGGGGGGTVYQMLNTGDDDLDLEDRLVMSRKTYNNIVETNSGISVYGGEIAVYPQDGVSEGGQITLRGTGVFPDWTWDSFQGRLRWFSGGTVYADLSTTKLSLQNGVFLEINTSPDTTTGIFVRGGANNFQIRANDNGLGAQQDATKPSWAVAFGEGATDNFTIYRKPPGGAYTQFWILNNGGSWTPGTTNTYDVGSTALRVRDIWIAGEVVGENGSNCSTAAQAAIGTTLTDLTGTTWAVGINETWEFEIFVEYSRNATAGSVSFAINGPAAMTTAFQIFGSTTSASVFSTSVLQNLVNTATPGSVTFGSTVSITNYFAVIRGRITTIGTAGTVAARAITVGAGSTMTPGYAHVMARRIS